MVTVGTGLKGGIVCPGGELECPGLAAQGGMWSSTGVAWEDVLLAAGPFSCFANLHSVMKLWDAPEL